MCGADRADTGPTGHWSPLRARLWWLMAVSRPRRTKPGTTQLHPGHSLDIQLPDEITRSQWTGREDCYSNILECRLAAEITPRWDDWPLEVRWPHEVTMQSTLIIGCRDKWHNINRAASLARDLNTEHLFRAAKFPIWKLESQVVVLEQRGLW